MAREEYFSQLSLIMMKLCLQSYTFCFYFILFLPGSVFGILIHKVCWERIHVGSGSTTLHTIRRGMMGGIHCHTSWKNIIRFWRGKNCTSAFSELDVLWKRRGGVGRHFEGAAHIRPIHHGCLCVGAQTKACVACKVCDFWPRGAWLSPSPR